MDDSERFNLKRYKHWMDDHVRFSDLDPVGHVNNNAIGQYFENARAVLFSKIMPSWPKGEHLFVLARTAVDYRRELHMPAKLRIGSGLIKIGHTSLVLANALFRLPTPERSPGFAQAGSDDGIAYCESVSVLIDQKTRKPVELPESLRQSLKEYVG